MIDVFVRNAIASSQTINSVYVKNDGRPRGSKKPVNFNGDGIYVRKNGTVLVGKISSSCLITLEGGNPNWDGAFVQSGFFPVYNPTQISSFLSIINYIKSIFPSISITSEVNNIGV